MNTMSPAVAPAASLAPLAHTQSATATQVDKCRANAKRDLKHFLAISGQLALLLGVFALYRVEESGFLRLAAIMFAAFAVHYWLPFQLKERWWIAVSLVGAGLIVSPVVAGLVVATGLGFYGVLTSKLAYRWRLAIIVLLALFFASGRATGIGALPAQFWPVFGAVFMFRMPVYLYDLRFAKGHPSLREFLAYFFPLPNFYFLLFPVIDFQTLRRTYYQRDFHDIAQQGIQWMARGAVQLSLYRLIYHLKPPFTPEAVTSFSSLVLGMVAVYLLYLRVSGQFHLIIGMLHLFGYDLPETHRKYLLSSSLTDFWRRINIYWKDFMVKLVYFPMYFRCRKRGETLAQVIATSAVFVATWALHSYQWFWLRGEVLLTWPDVLFWTILGALVVVNLIIETRRGPRPKAAGGRGLHTLSVVTTMSFIVVLWSLWNSPTVSDWIDVITWWRIG